MAAKQVRAMKSELRANTSHEEATTLSRADHDDAELALPALTVTIKVEGAPAVHLTYDPERPIAQAAVTVLDQAACGSAWSLEDVVFRAGIFLGRYWIARKEWPAELRAPCAGRERDHER